MTQPNRELGREDAGRGYPWPAAIPVLLPREHVETFFDGIQGLLHLIGSVWIVSVWEIRGLLFAPGDRFECVTISPLSDRQIEAYVGRIAS